VQQQQSSSSRLFAEVVQRLAEQQDKQGWTKQECEVALALMQR
jgi:hypothetical protein